MTRQAEGAPAGKICKVRHSRPSRRSYEVLRGAVQTANDSYQIRTSSRRALGFSLLTVPLTCRFRKQFRQYSQRTVSKWKFFQSTIFGKFPL